MFIDVPWPKVALWEYVYRNENKNDGYWMGNGYKVSTRQGVQVIPWTQV